MLYHCWHSRIILPSRQRRPSSPSSSSIIIFSHKRIIHLLFVAVAVAATVILLCHNSAFIVGQGPRGGVFTGVVEARSSSSTSSIPRSTNARSIWYSSSSSSTSNSGNQQENESTSSLPPWNPSPNIDRHGFLLSKYRRMHGDWEWEYETNFDAIDSTQENQRQEQQRIRRRRHVIGGKYQNIQEPVYIRQVPGDGNCLFHSLSVGLALLTNHTHVNMNRLLLDRIKNVQDGRQKRQEEDEEEEILESHGVQDEQSQLQVQPQRLGHRHPHPSLPSSRHTHSHNLMHLHQYSKHLRLQAVKVLSQHPRRLLFLQGNEYLRARDLVSAAAKQYGLSPEEYCNQMRRDRYWGGGPEIVALCNYLKRPIHVYELVEGGEKEEEMQEEEEEEAGEIEEMKEEERINDNMLHGHENLLNHGYHVSVMHDIKTRRKQKCHSQFQLRRMACFGSPKFDNVEALHILSADSRFPDVKPGKQLSSGNHFMAMFPESVMEEYGSGGGGEKYREHVDGGRASVRGGDTGANGETFVSSSCTGREKCNRNAASRNEKWDMTWKERQTLLTHLRDVGWDFMRNVLQMFKALCYSFC